MNDRIELGTQISLYRKENPIKIKSLIMNEVASLCKWFKTVRGVDTESELLDIANVIIESYWFLKFEEIQFCFSRVKGGKTNVKVLDRLDGSTIIEFLKEYDTGLRVQWSEAKANVYRSAEKKLSPDLLSEFNREEFYRKGKEYIDSQKKKEKNHSVGVRIMSDEERRRQYELLIPDMSDEEVSAMLKTAEEENNNLLCEVINEIKRQ